MFLIALLSFSAAYVGLLVLTGARGSSSCPQRWAIGLVVVLHAIVFAGPILLSTDVFSYIAYARMGVEHGLNPYVHGPIAIVGDPVYHYVGFETGSTCPPPTGRSTRCSPTRLLRLA